MVTSLWCKVESCGLVTWGADEDAAPIAPPSAGRSMALSRSKTLKVLISVVWWLWVESACQGGTSTRNGHREEKREEKDFSRHDVMRHGEEHSRTMRLKELDKSRTTVLLRYPDAPCACLWGCRCRVQRECVEFLEALRIFTPSTKHGSPDRRSPSPCVR